ncbi:MAG: ATP-binding protein, partial [Pseudomonadales bacterium]|nr:ATP-binding protein [Pseudomonadales bacterium]
MSLATLKSRAQLGFASPAVTVEVHLSAGLPAFNLVGLPEACVKEAKERVRSAILNSQYDFPASRITVNLAPADLPKDGGRFDLAIALGILLASEQLKLSPAQTESLLSTEFIAELSLSGALKGVNGLLASAICTKKDRRHLCVSSDNQAEAALVDPKNLHGAHLLSVCQHLLGQTLLEPCQSAATTNSCEHSRLGQVNDFAAVRGQQQAKRGLMIAAAGEHNLLMNGPAGCGKTMLAKCLPSIIPKL